MDFLLILTGFVIGVLLSGILISWLFGVEGGPYRKGYDDGYTQGHQDGFLRGKSAIERRS